jgi:hypothetical protein
MCSESDVRRLRQEPVFNLSMQDMDWLLMIGSIFRHKANLDNYCDNVDKLLMVKRLKVLLEKKFLKI